MKRWLKRRTGSGADSSFFLMSIFLLLILLNGCRTSSIACEDLRGCIIIRPGAPYQLVALLPLTGPAAYLGEEAVSAIELAIANQNNQFLEHPLELVVLDSACDRDAALAILPTVLAEAPPAAIIGPACSDVAAGIAPALAADAVLLISPLSTAPQLTDEPGSGFYRLAPNHFQQAEAAATFVFSALDARSAVVIAAENEYSQQLRDQFTIALTRLGGSVTSLTITPGEMTGFSNELEALRLAMPDAIYLPLYGPEANYLINLLRREDIDLPVIGSDTLFDREFAISGGEGVQGVYLAHTAVSGAAYEQFLRLWAAQGHPPAATAAPPFAYDAVNFLLAALEDVTLVSENGTLVIPRGALQERLLATSSYGGLTGTIACTPGGDCAADDLIGIYQLGNAEIRGENWPPPLIWRQ